MSMRFACVYTKSMSRMIQIKDVPDQVHRVLKARAAREGMSLSGYIKRELQRTAARPDMLEWLDRTQELKPLPRSKSSVQAIRELRDSR